MSPRSLSQPADSQSADSQPAGSQVAAPNRASPQQNNVEEPGSVSTGAAEPLTSVNQSPAAPQATRSQAAAQLVRLRGMTCAYGPEEVLTNVDLDLVRGDFVGIVGPSGSGKSTLLRAISGSLKPVRGTIHRADGLQVGFVPQVEHVNWDFPVTVAQCILMARHKGRLPWPSKAEKRRLAEVVERLDIASLVDRHIRALSGGQQQRMFIARALMADADLLLLDEPTSGLDVRTRHDVLHLLAELSDSGIGVVLTTHDLNGIAAHLPTLVCLNRTVIASGPSLEVLTPENLEATYRSPMGVLYHAGLPVVVDAPGHHHHKHPLHEAAPTGTTDGAAFSDEAASSNDALVTGHPGLTGRAEETDHTAAKLGEQ